MNPGGVPSPAGLLPLVPRCPDVCDPLGKRARCIRTPHLLVPKETLNKLFHTVSPPLHHVSMV